MTNVFDHLPRNHYRVIYADPPWTFETYSEKGKGRSPERHYSCMTLNDIKALPVRKLAADDCVLVLWTTWPHLWHAREVIEAWGFTYRTLGFIWVKLNPNGVGLHTGTGYWTRANTEPCFLAGNGKRCRVSNNVHQVVMTPRREHSRKPDQVADRIVELLGDVPRIELFARGSRPGWDVWGDEATQVASNSVRPTTATPVVERLVGTTSPKVIVYTYADGTHAWRYASENTLRYEAADEMLAAVRQQIKDAGELDPVLAAMMATGASPRGAP